VSDDANPSGGSESRESKIGVSPSPLDRRPTLNTMVLRRRTDQAFFLRVRDAIQQNHKALERLSE